MSQVERILTDLVEIPSVTSDIRANNQALDYIDDFLTERGMTVDRYIHDGCGSLVATPLGTKTPKLMLAAHVDVVPAPDDLFRVKESGDKLFGRGVIDMKSAIASFLTVTDQFFRQWGRLSEFDYGIEIVTNEEIGGHGTKNLLEAGYIPEVVILPDGGTDWRIVTSAKGAWTIALETSGVSAHGSRPWEGDSASFKLLDALNEIRLLFENQGPETNTLNISMLSGGTAQNQLPASAKAVLDIRVIGKKGYEEARTKILDICSKYGINPDVIAIFPPVEHDMSNPYVKLFSESIKHVTGLSQREITSMGSCDAIYFDALDIPCIVTRPAGGNQHSDNEWISKTGLKEFVQVLSHFMLGVCKVDI
jgi:succinyl-diaminopimelate desuccinylase